MSKEEITKFYELMSTNKEFRSKVESIRESEPSTNPERVEKFFEKLAPIAKEIGLEISFEEFSNVKNLPLSDQSLGVVTGGLADENGFWSTYWFFYCDRYKSVFYNTSREGKEDKICNTCIWWSGSTEAFRYIWPYPCRERR